MSLQKKFESSFSWQTINVVMQIILQLIFIAIMTRLLSKEDFGVLAIALVVVGFIEIFSQIGIGPALIQRKDLEQKQIRGSFYVSLILGISFFVLLYITAPAIGRFFEYEPLVDILRVIGISFIISALSIVPKSLIIKKMQFKKLFIAAMFALTIGNFGVGVVLAYMDYGVWAYVFALLAQNVIMSIFYWIQNPIDISGKWSIHDVGDMIRYGVGSTLFNLFNYAASKIDVVIVGRFGTHLNSMTEYDTNKWSKTGIYDRSVYLNSLPITVLGKLSDSVMFSGLSMIQDQTEKLKRTFLTGTYFISMLIFPATVFLIFFADDLVVSFYSDKYEAAVPIVRILFISVALRSLIKLSDAVVRALDAVYMASAIKFIFFLMVGIGSYFGLEYGLEGVAVAIVISVFIQYFLMTFLSIRLIGMSFSSVIRKMVPGIALGLLVALVSLPIFFLLHYLNLNSFVGLAISVSGNLIFLLILAWKLPWLFGKGKDNILIFILNKLPKWSFLKPIRRRLNLDE